MAAPKYEIVGGDKVRSVLAPIATATAISKGDLVTMSSGLIVAAAAASTAIALALEDHPANSGTTIEVTVGNDFIMKGTMDAVFAVAYRGGEYDINDTTQTIDIGASSTDVIKVSIETDTGVVGSASNVKCRINKPLF